MHHRDVVPLCGDTVGRDHREAELTTLLTEALGSAETCLTHCEPIEGWTHTAYIFYAGERPKAETLPSPLNARAMAAELRTMRDKAAYNPSYIRTAARGWQIRKMQISGVVAIVVIANWIMHE